MTKFRGTSILTLAALALITLISGGIARASTMVLSIANGGGAPVVFTETTAGWEIDANNETAANLVTIGNSAGGTITPGLSQVDPFLGALKFSVSGNANLPGSASQGNLSSTTLTLTNTSGSAQTINLRYDAIGFTLPTGTLMNVNSIIQNTRITGGTATGTLSTLFNGIVVATTPVGTDINPPGVTITEPNSGTYDLSNVYSVTINPGTSVNLSESVSTSPAPGVPEPGSLASALIALVPMGFYFRSRRYKSSARAA